MAFSSETSLFPLHKEPCDDTGPTCIIQDHLPCQGPSRHHTCKDPVHIRNHAQVPQSRMWLFGGHCPAEHSSPSLQAGPTSRPHYSGYITLLSVSLSHHTSSCHRPCSHSGCEIGFPKGGRTFCIIEGKELQFPGQLGGLERVTARGTVLS